MGVLAPAAGGVGTTLALFLDRLAAAEQPVRTADDVVLTSLPPDPRQAPARPLLRIARPDDRGESHGQPPAMIGSLRISPDDPECQTPPVTAFRGPRPNLKRKPRQFSTKRGQRGGVLSSCATTSHPSTRESRWCTHQLTPPT